MIDEYNNMPKEDTSLPPECARPSMEFVDDVRTDDIVKKSLADRHKKENKLIRRLTCMMAGGVTGIVLLTSAAGSPAFFTPDNIYGVAEETQSETVKEGISGVDITMSNGEYVTSQLEQNEETTTVLLEETSALEETTKEETTNPEEKTTPEAATEKETETVIVDCITCGGTGIICGGDPDFGYNRGNGAGYAGCGGTGYSKCPDMWCNDGVLTCQNCKGTGLLSGNRLCSNCNGTGIGDCEFCHNTGIAECISPEAHRTCTECNGEGKVIVIKEQ